MRSYVIFAVLVFAAAFTAFSQQAESASQQKTDAVDTSANAAPQNGYARPDAKTRRNRYINSLIGPMALGKNVAWAGIGTWRNSPEEWGDRWEGFGRRVASNFGKNTIKQTTIYGLDEAFKLDSHYYRSEKKDFGSKLANALISPITARDKNGNRVIGIPRIAGTYTSSIVAAETWYPARYNWKDGMKSGTISLGMNAAFNLVKEFIWKK
ncbi:MAG TPA: hypothetical protein VGQ55_08195 [Pyrinomonadaceae bacterium]|jgi:hypothetical protein|nr:hypothetical protein [Pyrinomonadaceae bacterium]